MNQQNNLLIYNLFRYTGMIGSTINHTFQLILNIIFTILSFIAMVVPFFIKNFYFTDNRFILCGYIVIIYLNYLSCIKYFKQKEDKLLYSNLEFDLNSSQKFMIKLTCCLFIIIGLYIQIGIPVSLIIYSELTLIEKCLTSIVGFYWLCFYIVCATFFLYINMYCMGQTTVIKNWLKGLKRGTYPTDIDSIYQMYRHHYHMSKSFKTTWNSVLLTTFFIISFRLPFSFILVIYANFYFEIPFLLFFIFCWFQLIIPICQLNQQNEYFKIYFIKHKNIIVDKKQIDELIEYNSIRMLGISFYGFTLKFSHVLSVVVLLINFVLPIFLSFVVMSLTKTSS